MRARLLTGVLVTALAATTVAVPPAHAKPGKPKGGSGAVSSVDIDATAIGLEVLRKGGNAIDAAVATAAAVGVTDPFSSGIGGGGFIVYYDAKSQQVYTLDAREAAPQTATNALFLDANGKPLPFSQAQTSGRSVGVPAAPAAWLDALQRWGTLSYSQALKPAEKLAREGFTVDATFNRQITNNVSRFEKFPATAKLYLPNGVPPEIGTTFANPDLADTLRALRRSDNATLYDGEVGQDVVDTVREPKTAPGVTVLSGDMTTADLQAYQVIERDPTHSTFQGMDVYGMAPPSSGGTAVGEILNIMSNLDTTGDAFFHNFAEASRLSFADRNRYSGDVPEATEDSARLLDPEWAKSRACLIKPDGVLPHPSAPGDLDNPATCEPGITSYFEPQEGQDTTHVTTADRWGNMVSYTMTIEAEGGSGMVVPNRGFILNNELTDFNFAPVTPGVPDPNLPGSSKRPRSSMSPTIVLEDGKPVVAVGSPGGSTIITTVAQVLLNRFTQGMSLADSVAAPRISQRNSASTTAEPAFRDSTAYAYMAALGHKFVESAEIGAVTAIERGPDGTWIPVAEPVRRGGGHAGVVNCR